MATDTYVQTLFIAQAMLVLLPLRVEAKLSDMWNNVFFFILDVIQQAWVQHEQNVLNFADNDNFFFNKEIRSACSSNRHQLHAQTWSIDCPLFAIYSSNCMNLEWTARLSWIFLALDI